VTPVEAMNAAPMAARRMTLTEENVMAASIGSNGVPRQYHISATSVPRCRTTVPNRHPILLGRERE
jgi:hypothetical protein